MTPIKPDTITITIHCNGFETVVQTYAYEYRNLMQLIVNQICVEDFGDCRGMGRCATCCVVALNRDYCPSEYERNEWTTLYKTGKKIPNLRLSCQVLIDKSIDGLHVEIAEPC